MDELEVKPDERLRACPFCGGKAKMHSGWTEDGDAMALVYCVHYFGLSDSCAAVRVERSDLETAERDATAMWNRRAE